MLKPYIFLLCIWLIALPCFSQSEIASNMWSELSKKPKWLKLVHYKKNTFGAFDSIVDDPNFFIAANGKSSPEEELRETHALFLETSDEALQRRCKFPARRKLLIEFGLLTENEASLSHCGEYWNWREENATESVWVIFPSAFLSIFSKTNSSCTFCLTPS